MLHLTEDDVTALLTPADAVDAIEACFRRMAAGVVENRPRYRLGLEAGALAVMAASDLELGYAGAKVYAGFRSGARFEVLLFRTDVPELVAVIDADKLGQLRTGAASDDAWLEVLDRGPGLPDAVRERLFEPYVSTKNRGSGLGLSLVRDIAAQHGGRITLENREGGGAKARLSLPLLPETATTRDAHP